MLLNIQLVLRERLVKVFLKNFEADSISIFMFAIVFTMLLKTVIRKVNIVVLIVKWIRVATSA